MIEVNGMKFEPLPGLVYRHNYVEMARRIATGYEDETGKWDELSVYREMMKKDLWFLLYFGMCYSTANHPFVVNACRMVERGPKDDTLDLWAREHFKSSIITKAETIQFVLSNPEKSTGIYAYAKPLAKKFLFEIKETFATSRFLKACFPDVLWNNPEKESPLWALDEGIVLRRRTNMAEPTVSAWGLTEGMPTGMHFDRRIYDDISTEDTAKSIDVMEAIKTKFDSSQNTGKEGGHHRVVGTYYHHSDPLVYIRNKKKLDGSGLPLYTVRLKPASHDGTATGKPVFISQERFDKLKATRTFNCQQLLNPTPEADLKLRFEYMNRIDPQFIPKGLFRVMLIDQAGDLSSNLKAEGGDSWAIAVVGVEPVVDEIGQSRVFLENLWVSPAGETEAIEQAVRMYLSAGIIQKLGVEKVNVSTTHIHIAQALKARGRHVEFEEYGAGVLLRPAGRNKKMFIEKALAWPLNNGKLFYSTAIGAPFIERLKMEMENFPLWHDDALNALSYTYDVLHDVQGGFEGCMPDPDENEGGLAAQMAGASKVGGY
jgi:hypothetical protein